MRVTVDEDGKAQSLMAMYGPCGHCGGIRDVLNVSKQPGSLYLVLICTACGREAR